MKNLLNLCYPFNNSLSFIIYFYTESLCLLKCISSRKMKHQDGFRIRMHEISHVFPVLMIVASCRDDTGEGLTLKKR